MLRHVGSDYRGGPLHYSCGVAGEDEGLAVEEGDGCCNIGKRGKEGGRRIGGVLMCAGA